MGVFAISNFAKFCPLTPSYCYHTLTINTAGPDEDQLRLKKLECI